MYILKLSTSISLLRRKFFSRNKVYSERTAHVGYIPVWVKKLEGRIIAIGVYENRLIG
jgi:hypothetical protein